MSLREEVTELLRALVRLDTVNPPGNETKAAELLRMTFRQFRYKLQKHNLAKKGGSAEE